MNVVRVINNFLTAAICEKLPLMEAEMQKLGNLENVRNRCEIMRKLEGNFRELKK